MRHLNSSQLNAKIIDRRTNRSYTVRDASTPFPEQDLSMHGKVKCVYTGKTLSDGEVDALNHYTNEFNRSRWRPDQDFLLDQRHKLYHAICIDNLSLKQGG